MNRTGQIAVSVLLVAIAVGGFGYQRGWFGSAAPALSAGGGQGQPASGGNRQGGVAAGGQSGQGGGARFGAGAPVPVITAKVSSENDSVDVAAVGTIAAARSVTLYPQVTGIVEAVTFTPGEAVSEGQVLLKLVDDDKQVAVEQAQLSLDTAHEALDRAQQLVKTNAVSTVSVTDAENAVRKAEIDLKAARIDLDKYTMRAPFAGLIGLTDLSVGDLVTPQKATATLDDMASVTVSFIVPERASGLVAVGQTVTGTTAALPGKSFTGKITAVDSRVDAATRSLVVQATLANDTSVLKPGMALNVTMSFPGAARPAVPSLAVQWDKSGSYVWTVADGVAHRAGVSIVGRRSGLVLVADGVSAGEDVVVEGLQRLREGSQVAPPGGGGATANGGGRPGPQATGS